MVELRRLVELPVVDISGADCRFEILWMLCDMDYVMKSNQ